ncbi:MAG: electron transfer flavoprotein-ubiquinone oxidoreductase [Chlorobiales bacterium]|nr:electron transfer flavoprotein-ubiquinone oxidoreductase [Chlorobiales bacterium]
MKRERESLEFDIVFIGAGPANLASAIHLQRLLKHHNSVSSTPLDPTIAIIDKGRYAGAHLLSGAILDTRTLDEFFPDYLEHGCPIEATVSNEALWYLSRKKKFLFPFLPEQFSNKGAFLVSLSRLGAWMAEEAEKEGLQFFGNTAASTPFFENERLSGIITDDKGIDKNGKRKATYEPGLLLKTKAAVIGEGSDGSFFRHLCEYFPKSSATIPQRYETGVKETWRIPAGRLVAGEIHQMFGYPLSSDVYGGGWLYAFSPTLLSLGFISSLGPLSPVCDPHFNLQRFKQHPLLAEILKGGSMIESGARTITSGGADAMPPLYGPGFLVTGESAGMVNMQRHKGLHLAMKSGTLAAETLFESLLHDDFSTAQLESYSKRFKASWAYEELYSARNYRSAFDKGLYSALLQAGLKLSLPGFSLPTKVSQKKQQNFFAEKEEFKPDGYLTFSKELSLFQSGIVHEENQPCHLLIKPENIEEICLKKCTIEFANPCQHFCPAAVYEIISDPKPSFKLNPSNCLHCKTCETADPYGIITWTPPEGGSGPGYKLS